ncbi:MAG: hypothetical protein Q4D29_12950 [Lachnospiraceae bacterium]|nr:hypothetical protein [Lachnospiraceae bacterium]
MNYDRITSLVTAKEVTNNQIAEELKNIKAEAVKIIKDIIKLRKEYRFEDFVDEDINQIIVSGDEYDYIITENGKVRFNHRRKAFVPIKKRIEAYKLLEELYESEKLLADMVKTVEKMELVEPHIYFNQRKTEAANIVNKLLSTKENQDKVFVSCKAKDSNTEIIYVIDRDGRVRFAEDEEKGVPLENVYEAWHMLEVIYGA